MTKEQLEQANKINNEIKRVKKLINYLKSKDKLSICSYQQDSYIGSYWYNIYIIEQDKKALLEYYQQKLKDLEKELEEL